MSFIERIKNAAAAEAAQPVDPWRLRLERVRGKVSDDNVERIATQAIFEFLEVDQGKRGAAACRRLSRLMRGLGWRPIRARGLNQRGLLEQIRGFARDRNGSPLS